MVLPLGDSNPVMQTGYIVPAKDKKTNKDLKLTPDMQKLLDKFKKMKKGKAATAPQSTERDGYVRMPDGSLQRAKIKFVPAKNDAEKKDLWDKYMNPNTVKNKLY